MKTFRLIGLFFIGVCLSVVHSYSQEEVEQKFLAGIHVAPILVSSTNGLIIADISIDYEKRLNARWSFNSGLEQYIYIDEGDWQFAVTSIPILFKRNYNKHFYFKGGTSLDIFNPLTMAFMAGLGFRLGFGYENEFSNGLVLSVNPYIRGFSWFWLIPSPAFFPLHAGAGVSLGIGYRF